MSKKVFQIGDVVTCTCPEGQDCELPSGLPKDALVKVVAAYVGVTYVQFNGDTFALPNTCVHPSTNTSISSAMFDPLQQSAASETTGG